MVEILTSGWVDTHLTRAHLHAVLSASAGTAARVKGTTARRIYRNFIVAGDQVNLGMRYLDSKLQQI